MSIRMRGLSFTELFFSSILKDNYAWKASIWEIRQKEERERQPVRLDSETVRKDYGGTVQRVKSCPRLSGSELAVTRKLRMWTEQSTQIVRLANTPRCNASWNLWQ